MEIGEIIVEYAGRVKLRKTSYMGHSPGDIVYFAYEDKARLGMVVSSARTENGIFLSTRLNTLINMFLLEPVSPDTFEAILNILYKNPTKCSYWGSPVVLGSLFGIENFRTFDVSKMSQIHSVEIRK